MPAAPVAVAPTPAGRPGRHDVGREPLWHVVIDALAQVEALDESESGLLSFTGHPAMGGIFVERGRICWAAATGLQRRLRDLLQEWPKMKGVDLDRVRERCRVEGRPLGEVLLEEGWVEPGEFETILRRHSAECLIELGRNESPTTWSPRAGQGYERRFTFRPLDVLFDVVDLVQPDARRIARAELASLELPGCTGAGFLVQGGRGPALPVAELGQGMTVSSLQLLGGWAMTPLRAAKELAATPAFTLISTAAGETFSVWWRGEMLYAIFCETRASLAAVTAHHLARR
jgi:hypothetical protein